MADELNETFNGPQPIVVETAPTVEQEIDAGLEFNATQAIIDEEQHEEVMECLHSLQESSTQTRESLRSLAERQTENPMLLQIQQQQGEILTRLESLKSSMESRPNPSSNESPPALEENSGRTGDQTDVAPAAEPTPPSPAPKKKLRFRVI